LVPVLALAPEEAGEAGEVEEEAVEEEAG